MNRSLTILVLLAAMFTPNSVCADDYNPPDWRGGPGTTYAIWEFPDANNPTSPDSYVNPYGIPSLIVTGAFPLTIWHPNDLGHSGVWRFEDDMVVTIPNSDVANPYKQLMVQVTYSASREPNLFVAPEGRELDTVAMSLIDETQIDDYYRHATYSVTISPNPQFEVLYIRPAECTTYVDELVIDTICENPCIAAIGDFVWHDLNSNGIQDNGEPGIEDVNVILMNDLGQIIATDTTDSGGIYEFTGLCAGSYTVVVDANTLPPGFVPSPCDQGVDDTKDNDCSPEPVTLTDHNSVDLTIDFGYYLPCTAAIGDFVWHDLNSNGIQDNGEPGIEDVNVILMNDLGEIIATDTTDSDGIYEFTGLCAGSYTVVVDANTLPPGFVPSPCDQGAYDTKDNDCSPEPVTLTNHNSVDLTIDFGYSSPPCTAAIGDFVWQDSDSNGIQDSGEPGIEDVNVILMNDQGQIIATDTTDSGGIYEFTGLCVGSYTVVVDANTLPPGFVPSLCNQGADDALDNNCSPVEVNLPDDSAVDLTIDFGYNLAPCELTVNKAACVILPPETSICDGKVVRMTLEYTGLGCDASSHSQAEDKVICTGDPYGAEPVDIVVSDKKGKKIWATAADVSVGDMIVVDAANGGDTDLDAETIVEIFDANSNVIHDVIFHTSCSQPLNLGDQFGSMLLLSLTTTGGGEVNLPQDDICITQIPPTEAACTSKVQALRLRYTGGGCAQSSHTQDEDKVVCWDNGQASAEPVRVTAVGDRGELWLDTNEPTVEFGDIVELIAANGGKSELSASTIVSVFDANDQLIEEVEFHTSCSQPLNLGDQFGSFEVFGMETEDGNNVSLAYDVEYTFTITNPGQTPMTNITVVDDMLGRVTGSPVPLILPGEANAVTLTMTATVSEETTNCVLVTANGLRSDFNGDGITNFKDYAYLCIRWRDDDCVEPDHCNKTDMDFSGAVDGLDLGILTGEWLSVSLPCEASDCATITASEP